ncbi:uncharacterized protein V1513DRAFT_441137 [Lipomyces chichibuensis]|uniref:uncharacterized protein n=1 Tax=Lipomyces chichibuensis TaxID=1546026 RepID=UPI0033442E68
MRYPSLSYNSLLQIATVVTIQSALHGCTAEVIQGMIDSSVKEYLSTHKPNQIGRIISFGSTTNKKVCPDAKSSKEPDGSFRYDRGHGRASLQVVNECGVSENYRALCDDKDVWLQRLGAKTVVLICLKETPRFKNFSYCISEYRRCCCGG